MTVRARYDKMLVCVLAILIEDIFITGASKYLNSDNLGKGACMPVCFINAANC